MIQAGHWFAPAFTLADLINLPGQLSLRSPLHACHQNAGKWVSAKDQPRP